MTLLVCIPEAVSWKLEMQRTAQRSSLEKQQIAPCKAAEATGAIGSNLSPVALVTASHAGGGGSETDGGSGGCLAAAHLLSFGPVLQYHSLSFSAVNYFCCVGFRFAVVNTYRRVGNVPEKRY